MRPWRKQGFSGPIMPSRSRRAVWPLPPGTATSPISHCISAICSRTQDAEWNRFRLTTARCRRAAPRRAAANRLIARLDDAFAALAEAEPLTAADLDDRALAEIHYLRGNLHFARGELQACRSERERGRGGGRGMDSAEWQGRAVGGLGGAGCMGWRVVGGVGGLGEG